MKKFIQKTIILAITLLMININYSYAQEEKSLTLVLDWTPNTNHTGIIVAQKLGYYKQKGLNINVVQPSKNSAELMVARGWAEFAISSEGSLLQAVKSGVPIVSIAAIIAHDTSGFYALAEKNIKTPKDFEGKTYGSWGGQLELATVKAAMEKYNADFNKLKIVTIGSANFFTAKNIDFVWGFAGWTGVEADTIGVKVNFIPIRETLDRDGYTPIIITNKNYLAENKDVVQKFMEATRDGYLYAIDHPKEAAKLLLDTYPELNRNLTINSQIYLSKVYKDPKYPWGHQEAAVWQAYIDWMVKHGVLPKTMIANQVFVNIL